MAIKIYYVDDEVELCEIFVEEFSNKDFEVISFCDPLSAIAACEKESPGLIFIDYRMPGMNGDKLAQKLNPDIKKILITAEIQLEVEAKFEAILGKPIMNNLVRDQLAKCLK